MSTRWDYRVVRHRNPGLHYTIRAVYYDDDGCVLGWDPSPVTLLGPDPTALRHALTSTRQALARPVLDAGDSRHNTDFGRDP